MELRTFNSISGIAYSAIRRATSENTLQYFVVERREWISKGMGFFSVKWFEPGSKSGIAFHRILNPEGKMMDVVEDYGIGTIDLKAFIKKNDKAPIQRMEYRDYMEAVKSLAELMKKNLQMIEGEFQKISSACRI